MFCSKCGSQMSTDALFCPKCGASQNEMNAGTQVPSEVNRQVPPQYSQQQALYQPSQYPPPQHPLQQSYYQQALTKPWMPWLPLILNAVALVVVLFLGSSVFEEVNAFDGISMLLCVGALAGTFFVVTKNRRVLRVVSIVISAFITLIMLNVVFTIF